MFQAFFRPSSGAQTVHKAFGICQACLLLPLAWVSAKSPTLAVAASKLDIYQMLYIQFELLMMDGKKPETCRALTAIKIIVQG
jgi:hypothetical protein